MKTHNAPSPVHPIRLLIADEHTICRFGLKTFLSGVDDFHVVGECEAISEILSSAAIHHPHVLVIGVDRFSLDDGKIFHQLQQQNPTVKKFVLFPRLHKHIFLRELHQNVQGFALKSTSPELLIQGIRSVAAGTPWQDPNISVSDLNTLSTSGEKVSPLDALSPREAQTIALVAQGKTNKQIAQALGITEKTIKNYLAAIFQKLHVTRRAKAAAIFIQHSHDLDWETDSSHSETA